MRARLLATGVGLILAIPALLVFLVLLAAWMAAGAEEKDRN